MERAQPRWRRKGGLETPLKGRFSKENRRLTFAPPLWYDALVVCCLVGGPCLAAFRFMGDLLPIPLEPGIAFFTGIAVTFAGLWGAFSNERMACNLTNRTYFRLEGQGIGKRFTKGSLGELEALVLVAEEWPVPTLGGRMVVYRLVLHWKGSKEPLLVAERETHTIPWRAPLNHAAGPILHRGAVYAQALQLPFYDNSHFHTPAPVPIV
jgi:hypothetical protein